jgi:glycosyltransferase involved in cell wall biosynthesis
LLHALRLKRDLKFALPTYLFGEQLLGDTLLRESSYRSSLDLILCLSPLDMELERWLGARRVEWLPRTITSAPLSWTPRGNRIGFVGTLDHTPNIEGLLVVLRRLSGKTSAGIRIRVVGGPAHIGRLLMKRFPAVDYLGELSDDDLRQEASTWNCFTHPIFCYPRGCSMKLATAIGWQIPVVTTTPGYRGYDWSRGTLSIADSPDEFSDLCLKMMDIQIAQQARAQVSEVAQSSPTIAGIGRRLASLLGLD